MLSLSHFLNIYIFTEILPSNCYPHFTGEELRLGKLSGLHTVNFQKVAQCPHSPIPDSRARALSPTSLCLASAPWPVADFAGTLEAVLSPVFPGDLAWPPCQPRPAELFCSWCCPQPYLHILSFRHLGLAGAATSPRIPLSQVKRADRFLWGQAGIS